mgnify:CR=1 FL=1
MKSSIPYKSILDLQNLFFRKMSLGVLERENILASSMGIDNPFFNLVLQTDIDAISKIDSSISEIKEFFAKYNVPWTWLVFPFSEPANLSEILVSKGMVEIETFAVMGLDMRHLLPDMSLLKHELREVQNSKDFDDWSIPVQEGFESSALEIKQFRALTENIPYGENNDFHHYVMYVDGIPLASGTMSLHNNNARLDNISVRPSYQRRGFGEMIINHMLREAKLLGVKYCFLDASYQGVGLYKKIGFEKYYTGRIFERKR